MALPKAERLKLFLDRLESLPACATAEEALAVLGRVLNAVEDEYSGVSFAPMMEADDGRMYPPLDDNRRDVDGRPDLIRYRTFKNNVWIGCNGAILIERMDRRIILDKAGQDGGRINRP